MYMFLFVLKIIIFCYIKSNLNKYTSKLKVNSSLVLYDLSVICALLRLAPETRACDC